MQGRTHTTIEIYAVCVMTPQMLLDHSPLVSIYEKLSDNLN